MSGNAPRQFILEPAEADADREVLIDAVGGDTLTRGELAEGVARTAGGLAALGLQPEQRVLMVMADRFGFVETFWGAMSMGAVPVPVSTMLTTKDYRYLIEDSRARVVVVSGEFLDKVLPALEGLDRAPRLLVEGPGDQVGPESLSELQAASDPAPLFPATGEDIAFWLYTSGTTGFPKGVLHRHVDMSFLTEKFGRGVMGIGEEDRMYAVPKLFFAYGLGVNYFALGLGASQVLFDGRPTVPDVVDHVGRYRPTLFWGVPTFLAQLLSAEVPPEAFSSVRAAVTGGETLPDDIRRRCEERFGFPTLDAIGSTELAHIYICNRIDRQRPASVGWVVDGFEVEIRDPAGVPVPDGEPGELHVAGESVTPGYWRRTARNREVFHGRYFATGDTFVRNEDGSYTYLGRGDDMIKAGGIWVSPTEVEAAIVELPEVVMAAVVGHRDDQGLEKPKAFVVLEESALPSDELAERIKDHVRSRLAPFKYPRWVEFVEDLPLTATGKVKRYMLRESS